MNSRGALAYVLLLSSLIVDLGQQCMPGTGYGRRQPNRKQQHGPVLFKQMVPSLAETSLGASGVIEGAITRESARFTKQLVVNGNPDIVFKDNDGTGSVRLMTQRCKDRVNTLSVLVMNQWPGVRLRVIKAWQEEEGPMVKGAMTESALHQEGRAVDLATSDRDIAKLGTVARLAIDAGFDWVYYESRGHIHCSVKSDSFITAKMGGCFNGRQVVRLESGHLLPMSSLSIGDRILTTDPLGRPVYDSVVAFLHLSRNHSSVFVELETDQGGLALTPQHLIFSSKSPSEASQPYFTGDIEVGDIIYEIGTTNDTLAVPRVVRRVSYTLEKGLYAPLTSQGTIVVEGYMVSCYGVINSHSLAHAAMWPIRSGLLPLRWRWEPAQDDEIHWYAALLYRIFSVLILEEYWYPI